MAKPLAVANLQSLNRDVLSPLIQGVKDTDSSLCQNHRLMSGSLEGYLNDVSTAYDKWRRALDYENPLRWSYVLGVYPDSVVAYGYGDDDDYFYASVAYTIGDNGLEFGEVTPVNVDMVVSTLGISAQDAVPAITETEAIQDEAKQEDTAQAVVTGEAGKETPEAETEQSVAEGDAVEIKGEGEAGDGGGETAVVEDDLKNPVAPAAGQSAKPSGAKTFDTAAFLKQSAFGQADKLLQGAAYDSSGSMVCKITQSEVVDVNGKKHLAIQGVATKGNIVNANGQVYPTSVWQSNLEYMNAEAARGKFVGKLEHPDEDMGLQDVAILFHSFEMQGDELNFTGIVVPTQPHGANLQTMIEAGVSIDLSSRGYGSTKQQSWQGTTRPVIQDDFVCTHFDAVWHGASFGSGITAAEYQSKAGDKTTPEQVQSTKQENKPNVEKIETTETPVAEPVAQAAAPAQENEAQKQARALRAAREVTEYRSDLVKTSELSDLGQSALRTALDKCETLEAIKQTADTMLPILAATFPAPTAAAGNVTQSATYAPKFFVKQSAEDLAPKSVGEMFDRMVADLPDAYPNAVHNPSIPNHFQSPREACKRVMINIAKESQGSFNGRSAARALLALEQGRTETAEDILTQSFSADSTIANGNVENDGAPLSAPLIFPLVRRVYAMLILNRIAAIQPMDRPTGKIFYIDHLRTADPAEGQEKRIDLNTSANPFNPTYAVNNTEGSAAKLLRMRLNSILVQAETRKLGAQWSIEEMQDLRAYHGLDAAGELMMAVAKEMAQEINADVLNDMIAQATGGVLNFGTGLPSSGFTQQKDWDEYLWVYIQSLDNKIFGKRQAPMTHLVCGMDAALALAKSGRGVFNLGGDASGNMDMYPGATFFGRITSPTGSHYEVFKTNYWASGTANSTKIMGLRKGTDWSDTPYIYAPYTEYMTPQFTDPEDFSVKQGMMTRSAKQVVVSDAIGYINIQPGVQGTPLL